MTGRSGDQIGLHKREVRPLTRVIPTHQKRRSTWLGPARVAVVLAMVGTACAPAQTDAPTASPADGEPQASQLGEASFDWRAHEGSSIHVLSPQMLWSAQAQEMLPEFEELTGISVELETLPEEQFFERSQIQLTAAGELDVFTSHRQLQAPAFADAGFYEDLGAFADDPAKTSADYSFSDIAPDIVEENEIDGVLTGIPINVAFQVLYYRRDLLDEFSLDVPDTLEALEEAVQAIDGYEGVHGFVARGRGGAAIPMATAFLENMGGSWFTDDGVPAFTSEEAVRGFDLYASLLRDYGPPGAVNNNWQEALPIFAQGQAAFFPDSSAFINVMLDPEQSTITDVVGVAPMPAGPANNVATYNAWSLAISSSSENKDAAWYFVQWFTSRDVMQRMHDVGWTSPRESVEHSDTLPEDWRAAYDESLTRPNLPFSLEAPAGVSTQAVVEAIGVALVEAIQGGDVEQALQDAEVEVNALLGR